MLDLNSLMALFGASRDHGMQPATGWNPAGQSPIFGMKPTARTPWNPGTSAQMQPPMSPNPSFIDGVMGAGQGGQPQIENPPLPPATGGPLPPVTGGPLPPAPPLTNGNPGRPMGEPPGSYHLPPGYGAGAGSRPPNVGQPVRPMPRGGRSGMTPLGPRPDKMRSF